MKMIKFKLIEYLLRLAVFLTFFGHGVVAVQGNLNWVSYLEFVGFSFELSKNILIAIGVLDIFIALIVLLKPNKYIVIWAAFWAFSVALIRPISGESIWAFIERGSNWIAPLVLYIYLQKNKK